MHIDEAPSVDSQKSPEHSLELLERSVEVSGGSPQEYAALHSIGSGNAPLSERVSRIKDKIVKSFAASPQALAMLSSLCLATLSVGNSATAQEKRPFPSSLTIAVPFAAGGPSDVTARILGKYIGPELGTHVIVLNVPGAGGALAARRVAQSASHESIALFHNNGLPLAQITNPNFPTDADPRDMKAAGQSTKGPVIFVGTKAFPGDSLKEFFDWMKANPAKAIIGHGGIGSPSYICTLQLLGTDAELKPAIVPFTGAGQALMGVLRGDVSGLCALSADALGHIREGNVKAIAASSRVPQLPNIKTTVEQGLPEIDSVTNGILFPKGTSEEVVNRFSEALMAVMKNPDFQSDSLALGLTVIPLADDATAQKMREDHARAYLDELARYSQLLGKPVPPRN